MYFCLHYLLVLFFKLPYEFLCYINPPSETSSKRGSRDVKSCIVPSLKTNPNIHFYIPLWLSRLGRTGVKSAILAVFFSHRLQNAYHRSCPSQICWQSNLTTSDIGACRSTACNSYHSSETNNTSSNFIFPLDTQMECDQIIPSLNFPFMRRNK
jgi:hypothetical protein